MPRFPQKSYSSRAMNREDFSLYLLVLTGLLGFLGFGLWRVYLGYTRFGPAAMAAWGQPWFIAAAWTSVPLFLLTVRAVIFSRREVVIAEPGLVIYGMSRKLIPWKNLEGIAVEDTRYHLLNLTLRTRCHVRLFLIAGKQIGFDDRFEDLSGLAETIKKKLYPLILPSFREKLNEGQWIYFGSLRFNKTTLDCGKRAIPWEEIQSLRIQRGMFVIALTEARPLQIPTAKIPNVELLLHFVEELYTEQRIK
jgi:hypothetical protein